MTLAPWPDKAQYKFCPTIPPGTPAGTIINYGIASYGELLMYEAALRRAWESRCRLAVEALKQVQESRPNEHYYVYVDEALALIDLPGEG